MLCIINGGSRVCAGEHWQRQFLLRALKVRSDGKYFVFMVAAFGICNNIAMNAAGMCNIMLINV